MKVAIVPARGKSKRIKNKNIINFRGKPIIHWPLIAAKKSKLFSKIIVSTDNKKIAKISRKIGAETPFIRPPHISDDKTGILRVIRHAILNLEKKKIRFKYVCCIFATAPFINAKILKKSFNKLKNGKYDFVFSAKKIEYNNLRSFYLSKNQLKMLNEKFYSYTSQDLPKAYVDLGQFYWGTKNAWKKKKIIYTRNSSFIELDGKKFRDINTISDLKKAKISRKIYSSID